MFIPKKAVDEAATPRNLHIQMFLRIFQALSVVRFKTFHRKLMPLSVAICVLRCSNLCLHV